MTQDELKTLVGQAALQYVPAGALIGVGTGSTVNKFIAALSAAHTAIRAVSSSEASTALLRAAGIAVVPLEQAGELAVYIDGADEIDPRGHMLKGGGGAHVREKIVANAADRFICIADESKYVSRLGRFPLPVEVVPLARSMVSRQLVKLGGRPELRIGFRSAGGNEIVDVEGLDLSQPLSMEDEINRITGVIDNGLFAHRPADLLVLARASGVEVLKAQV